MVSCQPLGSGGGLARPPTAPAQRLHQPHPAPEHQALGRWARRSAIRIGTGSRAGDQVGGTAGSGVSPTLVFSCPGRIACGAPACSQIRAPRQEETLSLAVSCCWRPSQRGGSEPRSASQPGRGNGARAVAGLSGQPDGARCQRGQHRRASPLGWWSRSGCGPVATAASPCHSRPYA